MKRSLDLFISDILEGIKNIEDFTEGTTKAEFMGSKEKQSAVTRQVEIIGEAVKNIPNSFRDRYPEVPWNDIAGFRELILHSYFRIDLDILWKVVKENLPELKTKILKISRDLKEGIKGRQK